MCKTARSATTILFAILIVVTLRTPVGACACCSEFGQRNVAVRQVSTYMRDEISKVRFASGAELFAVGGPEDVKGIRNASSTYQLEVSREVRRWVFRFKGDNGNGGSLFFELPQSVNVFEIDPRDQDEKKDQGRGPILYKEWRLTSVAKGDGIFAPGMGPQQRITLILQGRGNSCTQAEDFTHWTMIVHGPDAEYSLFGRLAS
jgi:hypothetical protein